MVRVPEGVRLHVSVTDPACLPCLEPLAPEGFVSLGLNKTRVTTGSRPRSRRLAGLRHLNLSKARAVGDEGLAHPRGLVRLEVLDLYARPSSSTHAPV